MMLGILFGLFFLLLFIGMPVAYGMVISAVVTLFFDPSLTGIIIPQKLFTGMDSFSLMAVPFFMLAGTLMEKSGITDILVNWAKSLVGHFKGGLGHATIVTGVVMAGVSGSANADTSALASILVPIMRKDGYDDGYSCALVSSCGALGPVIPPSIMMVLYSGVTSIAIGKLFMAGIIPGLVIAIGYMIVNGVYARKAGIPKSKFVGWKALGQDTLKALPALIMPVIIIGGILSGVFTPTEGAAVASLYAFFLTMFIYREITWKDLAGIIRDTAKETASIMFIVCASSLYGYLLTRTQLPTLFMNMIFAFTENKIVILLLLNVFFLVIGMFMETNAALIILVPILAPMANALGIDLLHLGVMIVLNLMIGLLTPPVGMCLYATAKVARISLDRMIKAILPFYVPLLIALLLVTFVPGIVTWLPNLLIH